MDTDCCQHAWQHTGSYFIHLLHRLLHGWALSQTHPNTLPFYTDYLLQTVDFLRTDIRLLISVCQILVYIKVLFMIMAVETPFSHKYSCSVALLRVTVPSSAFRLTSLLVFIDQFLYCTKWMFSRYLKFNCLLLPREREWWSFWNWEQYKLIEHCAEQTHVMM